MKAGDEEDYRQITVSGKEYAAGLERWSENWNLRRRAWLARSVHRAGGNSLFLDLSRIPIPDGIRLYGFKAGLISAPSPRWAWKAKRHQERREQWIRDLAVFYGEEGAKRIAYWLR